LLGIPKELRPLGSHRRRWKENNKMGLQEIGDVDWIDLAPDRDKCQDLVSKVMNQRI
jgi:uncharacterized phage-like protein YoqJ